MVFSKRSGPGFVLRKHVEKKQSFDSDTEALTRCKNATDTPDEAKAGELP
jgi:hypothetical protein